MTMNMHGLNAENGNKPPTGEPFPATASSEVFDPSAVEAMANQFYTAIPEATPSASQAIGTVSPPENLSPGTSSEASLAPGLTLSEAALTQMAKQLSAEMLPAKQESRLKQALAALEPVMSSPEIGWQFSPTDASSQGSNTEAVSNLAQQLSAQMSAIALPHSPTSLIPLSETDLDRPVVARSAVRNPSPVRETPEPLFYFLSPPTVNHLGLESGAPFDVDAIRKDFPILHQRVHGKPLIWLDNAATTQKPQSVIDALSRFYQRDNSNIHRAAHTLAARATDAYEGARDKVQRFIGASSREEIIFVSGATAAINLVAQTYGRKYIREGDEILLSTLEHHANIVPWQMLAQETGAIIKVIPVSGRGEILLEDYTRLLGPRTRIVGITQVSNALGTILPVAEMTQIAHHHSAIVLIDGAQAVSHLPVNVQAIGCDFYAFSGHKLFAPTGIGVLYGKREILEDLPPWQGGGSMIRSVSFEKTTYSDPPAKFEAGTPNIADAVGLGVAIDYVTRLGTINIEQYEHRLTQYAMERLAHITGLRLIGTASHKVSVLSFVFDDIPVEQVGQYLAQEGIAVRAGHHCAQPTMQRYGLTGTVRPSLAFYNTCEEIDTLVEVLRRIRFR